MYPPKPGPNIQPQGADLSELKNPSALRTVLVEAAKNENEECIKDLMQSILCTVDVMLLKEKCEESIKSFFTLCEKYTVYSVPQVVSKELRDFYMNSIVLSKKEIVELACDTLQQSKSDKWFSARYLRVSASQNAYSIKSRKTKTVESLVGDMLFPKQFDVSATQYGRSHEADARKLYEAVFDVKVETVGVIVSEKQPWLCASLDGVVFKNNTIVKIVEFKCPSSCQQLPIVNFEEKKCNVGYLKFCGDGVELRENTVYYTQCQIQMYISGLNVCDLFIYTPVENGSICITLHRNEKFLQEVVIKCEIFYFQNFLPELYKKVQVEKSTQNAVQTDTKAASLTRRFTGKNIGNKI